MTQSSTNSETQISILSNLVIQGYSGDYAAPQAVLDHLQPELDAVASFNEEQFGELLELADTHHVTIRAFQVLGQMAQKQQQQRVEDWCRAAMQDERTRIGKAVEWLYAIVQALQVSGCPTSVIKSL